MSTSNSVHKTPVSIDNSMKNPTIVKQDPQIQIIANQIIKRAGVSIKDTQKSFDQASTSHSEDKQVNNMLSKISQRGVEVTIIKKCPKIKRTSDSNEFSYFNENHN